MVENCLPSEYLPQADEAGACSLPQPDNAETLLADESIVTPEELIDGVLHRGLKAVIGGSSKACKTFTLLDIAIAVATGGRWLSYKCRQDKVLFMNFEIPRPFLRKRIRALKDAKAAGSLTNLDVVTLRGRAAPLAELADQVIAMATGGSYALIIIDPIYKCYGGADENKASDIAGLCNTLDRIASLTGAGVLYAAHYSKGNQAGKETLDRISGSGVFTRDADSIIGFTQHSAENCYTVEMTLRNLAKPQPFVVEWKYPLMVVRDDLDPAMLKESKPKQRGRAKSGDDVLIHVPPGRAPILKDVLIEQCKRSGMSGRQASALILELTESDRLFEWKIDRPGKRSAVGFAREPQPRQQVMEGAE